MIGPYLAEAPRSAITPATPSQSMSFRRHSRSPSVGRTPLPPFNPTDRALPPRDVSDETIDEAYAAFILYCNPSFSVTTDTTELQKSFRQPPKSDGKSFSIWRLYELVTKYEEKEIKTWVELALELGVEKPALEKGQSTQKVQQYSVRLKRWMRAMHVDAFFDFLRASPKEYYTHIPPPHDPYPENGRDGIPVEEDLAIRALDPSMRPKRGRRKADEMDEEEGRATTPDPKRPNVESAIDFPSSHTFATPSSAYPPAEDGTRYGPGHDPWTAASAITPASLFPSSARNLTPYSANPAMLRWRVNASSADTPITPHPLSAVTPASAPVGWEDEGQSAVTPRGKMRRRHGPLVSSAWSSTTSTQNGKLRGRPPSNRTVRDGPFSTFPANPRMSEMTPVEASRTPISTAAPPLPPALTTANLPPRDAAADSPVPQSTTSTQYSAARRERLQLQVPERKSGPVHLITPPTTGASATPTLLVNGQNNVGMDSQDSPPPQRGTVFFGEEAADSAGMRRRHSRTYEVGSAGVSVAQMMPPDGPGMTPRRQQADHAIGQETLKRALAHDLLRATLSGSRKRKRLRGHEAKGLATAVLARMEGVEASQAAAWLGLSADLGVSSATPKPSGEGKKITCHRFRVGEDGYDSPVDEEDDDESAAGAEDGEAPAQKIRETFDVSWSLSLGGLVGDFQLKGLTIAAEDDDGGAGGRRPGQAGQSAPNEASWREKWEKSQQEVRQLRDKILEAVL